MPTISLTITDLTPAQATSVLGQLGPVSAHAQALDAAPAATAPKVAKGKPAKAAPAPKEPETVAADEGDTTDAQAGGDPFGLSGEDEAPAEEYTLDQIKAAAAAFMKAKQAPALEKVIISFKKADGKTAGKMSEILPQDYAAFMQKVAL